MSTHGGCTMAFMAQLWKDPRSGIYYIRRRVPKNVKPYLPQVGEFYKRSLETSSGSKPKLASHQVDKIRRAP